METRLETAVERAVRCGTCGNLWGVLGLPRDAGAEGMRGALRAARLATHPDRNRDSDTAEAAATEAAKWVAKAAEVLGNSVRRDAYKNAGYNLAAYEAEMAAGEKERAEKRQREEDEKAERQAK